MRMSFFLSLFMLLCSQSASSASLPDTVAKIKPSVVGVGFYAPMATVSNQLKGTGFVVGDGRYVVTNNHVITAIPAEENIKFNQVIFVPEGKRHRLINVKQVFSDKDHDIAILELDKPLLPVKLSQPNEVINDGTDIAITGFPIGAVLGLFPATHKGIVAALTPNIISASNSKQLSEALLESLENPFMVYQLDITAFPGNSGSPVYEADTGRVFGVINKVFVQQSKEAAISAPSGITYAIPVAFVYELAKKHGIQL